MGAPKISENRFLFLQGSQTIRISRCRYLFNGRQMLFRPGVKRSSREADHSTASSAEIKNVWSYTSHFPVCLHDMVFSAGVSVLLPAYATSLNKVTVQ